MPIPFEQSMAAKLKNHVAVEMYRNPRRWLSYDECMANCIHPGSYEDCPNCEDGLVKVLNPAPHSDMES